MRRKVARIGPSTLMVSLPSKWCRKYTVKQGDELEVQELKDQILISSGPAKETVKKTSVDISEATSFRNNLLAALYKAGYDEVFIHGASHADKQAIQDFLGYTCLGYAVMEEKKDSLLIKDIAKLQGEEFDSLLRKVFLLSTEIMRLGGEILKKRSKELLKELVSDHHTLHKYSDACRRIIHKEGERSCNANISLTQVINEIDHFTRRYREMSQFIVDHGTRAQQWHLHFLRKINALYAYFTKLFYGFSLKKTNHFYTEFLTLEEEFLNRLQQNKKQDPLLAYFGLILYNLRNLRGPILMMHA